MARAEITGRKRSGGSPAPRSPTVTTGPPDKRPAKSIAEFCDAYGINRSTFNNWRKAGIGPAVTQPIPGGRALITEEFESA